MKIINTLTVLLLSFALHQTTVTIDPSKLTDGQEIYSFDGGGMYNALISSNLTFQPIGNVSIDAASGNKTATINNNSSLIYYTYYIYFQSPQATTFNSFVNLDLSFCIVVLLTNKLNVFRSVRSCLNNGFNSCNKDINFGTLIKVKLC